MGSQAQASRVTPSVSARSGAERRLLGHAFFARLYFYVPVLVLHMETQLGAAGVARPRALSLSLLAFMSVGMILAEYPSGVLADWLGRKRTLILSGMVQAAGVLCFLVPASLPAMVTAQVLIGVGTAFRSGADTSLLHSVLERERRDARYGAALARLRFFNVSAIASASAVGGALYAWDPRAVFVAAAAASLLGLLPLLGVDEPPMEGSSPERRYLDVLRQSLGELRENHRARALTWLGGVGNPYFPLTFWAIQTHLVDLDFPLVWLGVTVASMSALQALTMPLSVWLSHDERRSARALPLLVLLPAAAFALVAVARGAGLPLLGTVALVLTSGCHVLYRNAVNVRLQAMVPDAVRASVVSMEAFIGSLWYLALFPIAGWLLSTGGVGQGFAWLGGLALLTVAPSLARAIRLGVLRPARG
jgi:MFS family permease